MADGIRAGRAVLEAAGWKVTGDGKCWEKECWSIRRPLAGTVCWHLSYIDGKVVRLLKCRIVQALIEWTLRADSVDRAKAKASAGDGERVDMGIPKRHRSRPASDGVRRDKEICEKCPVTVELQKHHFAPMRVTKLSNGYEWVRRQGWWKKSRGSQKGWLEKCRECPYIVEHAVNTQ